MFFDAPNIADEGSHKLFYDDIGPKEGEIAFCVHGLTRNHHDFNVLATALTLEGYRVVGIDMPGRGESDYLDNVTGYTYPAYVADCLALLDHLNIKKVHWIGTSMGGIMGMMAAVMHPDRLQSLFLNDVGSLIPKETLEYIAEYAANPPIFESKDAAKAYLQRVYGEFGIPNETLFDAFVNHSIMQDDEGYRMAYDPKILDPLRAETEGFTKFQDIDLSELWAAVQHPTLIFRGENSQLLSQENAESMVADRENAWLEVIPGCGHAPSLMEEHQIKKLVNWLKTTT